MNSIHREGAEAHTPSLAISMHKKMCNHQQRFQDWISFLTLKDRDFKKGKLGKDRDFNKGKLWKGRDFKERWGCQNGKAVALPGARTVILGATCEA